MVDRQFTAAAAGGPHTAHCGRRARRQGPPALTPVTSITLLGADPPHNNANCRSTIQAGNPNLRGVQMKFVALAVLAAALIVPAAFARTPTLKGVDGPGFTITLKQGTKKVSKLKAGTYIFKINDRSNIHNFHLTGPGVNKKTSVGKTGTFTWKLKLKKGTYKFICDPHASLMKGSFKVT
jgi:plastocyanin